MKEKINHLKENNKFFKFIFDGKNIAIIILSFFLFCAFCAYSNPVDITKYENEINGLTQKLENTENQITKLQEENKSLQESITKMQNENKLWQEEKTKLETEKQELTTKVEELQKTISEQQTKSTVSTSSTSNNSSTSVSTSQKASSSQSTSSSNNNSQMVWVGETGNKYHYQNCRTLKGKGHQITMQQALAEGRQACKVCH